MRLKETLTKIVHEIETDFDNLQDTLRQKLKHRQRDILIQPYLGFGTGEEYFIQGRVLEDRTPGKSQIEDTPLENAFTLFLFAESNEIANARLRITRGNQEWVCTTDEEGHFNLRIEASGDPGWQQFDIELIDAPVAFEPPVTAVADMLIPPPDANFGVISDIDDTVLISQATNKLKALLLMALNNALTRLPFHGVAAFYQALQLGPQPPPERHASNLNPIFYVSSSPWNLYEMLTDFFAAQDIPRGPIFLQDYGFNPEQLLVATHSAHKKRHINHIINSFPHLKFVLIGDSGQKDPEIYREMVQAHPGRISAIYIRDVRDEARDAELATMSAELEKEGVPLQLVPDSLAAAEHAVQIGLIAPEQIPTIQAAMQEDV